MLELVNDKPSVIVVLLRFIVMLKRFSSLRMGFTYRDEEKITKH
jgi:hypothetical protein